MSQSPLTVREASERLGFSLRTITRLFECEPGVLILDRPERMHKRRYRSMRIPPEVFARVKARLQSH